MGQWIGSYVTDDGTDFTPTDEGATEEDPYQWQVGNEVISEQALMEFVEAITDFRRNGAVIKPGITKDDS
jgi:hypothetical protein